VYFLHSTLHENLETNSSPSYWYCWK
jgi:hypothetical protein